VSSFFSYECLACSAPVCERVMIMNLALGYEDDIFCLTCLAQDIGASSADIAEQARDYVMARDCFRSPWSKFDASACPRQAEQSCPCQ
jgi:hypothetical protein